MIIESQGRELKYENLQGTVMKLYYTKWPRRGNSLETTSEVSNAIQVHIQSMAHFDQ